MSRSMRVKKAYLSCGDREGRGTGGLPARTASPHDLALVQ